MFVLLLTTAALGPRGVHPPTPQTQCCLATQLFGGRAQDPGDGGMGTEGCFTSTNCPPKKALEALD